MIPETNRDFNKVRREITKVMEGRNDGNGHPFDKKTCRFILKDIAEVEDLYEQIEEYAYEIRIDMNNNPENYEGWDFNLFLTETFMMVNYYFDKDANPYPPNLLDMFRDGGSKLYAYWIINPFITFLAYCVARIEELPYYENWTLMDKHIVIGQIYAMLDGIFK